MSASPRVAIVDYGMGNLFSVQQACERVGLRATITPDPEALDAADAVILPGVGAFGDAMEVLRQGGLAEALVGTSRSGRPLLGICLGLQLLLDRSYEFGTHEGLGVLPGEVVPLVATDDAGDPLKVPQVGWNRVWPARESAWKSTVLDGLPPGVWQYFVHSFIAAPADPSHVLAVSRYGDVEFCSAAGTGNVLACQFHPERSGPVGLRVYERLAEMLRG